MSAIKGKIFLNYSPNLICSSWMYNFAHGYTNLLTSPSLSTSTLLSKLPLSTYTLTFIFFLCVHLTVFICSPFHTFTRWTTHLRLCPYVPMFHLLSLSSGRHLILLHFMAQWPLQRDCTFYEDLFVRLWFIYRLCQYWGLDCEWIMNWKRCRRNRPCRSVGTMWGITEEPVHDNWTPRHDLKPPK
jgi:hypothetical protein